MVESTKILGRGEIATVFGELHRKRRSTNTRQNLIVFRLATCCGLRVSEISGLELSNLKLDSSKPHIYVPAAIAKRNKARRIPLHWDGSNLAALREWKQFRLSQAKSCCNFVCVSQAANAFGKQLSVRNLQNRWKAAIKVLGAERVETLSIHCGRHSFCSHALAGGRTLAEVRDAAGHSNVATTSLYLHTIFDDDDSIGNLFNFTITKGLSNEPERHLHTK